MKRVKPLTQEEQEEEEPLHSAQKLRASHSLQRP